MCCPPAPLERKRIDLQILRINLHIHIFRFRKHSYSGGRGVNPSLRLCFRHALNPVDAAFKFQPEKAPSPSIIKLTSLKPPNSVSLRFTSSVFQPFFFRVHTVHAVKIGGKQRRFLAACPAPDFHDHILFVVGILRQKQEFQLFFQPGKQFRVFTNFFLSQLP